jgi:hypothetical protein
MRPKVANLKNYSKDDNCVYIGRGSKWGNPFSHLSISKAQYKVKTRKEAIEAYQKWIRTQPHLMESLHELIGKTLLCFCKPQSCHGDVLADLVEEFYGTNNLIRFNG